MSKEEFRNLEVSCNFMAVAGRSIEYRKDCSLAVLSFMKKGILRELDLVY